MGYDVAACGATQLLNSTWSFPRRSTTPTSKNSWLCWEDEFLEQCDSTRSLPPPQPGCPAGDPGPLPVLYW